MENMALGIFTLLLNDAFYRNPFKVVMVKLCGFEKSNKYYFGGSLHPIVGLYGILIDLTKFGN